jgi:hypothetical protein
MIWRRQAQSNLASIDDRISSMEIMPAAGTLSTRV